jgi:hypothetical protein
MEQKQEAKVSAVDDLSSIAISTADASYSMKIATKLEQKYFAERFLNLVGEIQH